jgi:hypothetical protein
MYRIALLYVMSAFVACGLHPSTAVAQTGAPAPDPSQPKPAADPQAPVPPADGILRLGASRF